MLCLIFAGTGTGTDAVDGGSSMMVDIGRWPILNASCPRRRERGCPSFAAFAKLGTTDPDSANLHYSVIGSRTAECDSISLIISAHPGEGAAPRHLPLEMVNVRRLQVQTG
jgi:hypothetical protein